MKQRIPDGVYAVLLILLFFGASALSGCDAFGPRPNVDSTADAILEAKATAKAYALLVGDLLDAGVIDADQAREQLTHLRTVQRELEAAADVLETSGDPFAAADALERTDAALALVLTFLADYQEAR